MNTTPLLELISRGLDPNTISADRLQVFLDDPENLRRLTEFFQTYEYNPTRPIIVADLPGTRLPAWSSGRVLSGVIRWPVQFDFTTLMSSPWFHPCQTGNGGENNYPSGPEILHALVKSYDDRGDKEGDTYAVTDEDAIHGHFGLTELTYLVNNWPVTPGLFQSWATGKTLYGWRDAARSAEGNICVPALHCAIQTCHCCKAPLRPYVSWEVIQRTGGRFDANRPALYMPSEN